MTTKLLKVDIDFDSASKAWRANKIPLENGMFRYRKDNTKPNQRPNQKQDLNINHTYFLRSKTKLLTPIPKTPYNSRYNLRPRY